MSGKYGYHDTILTFIEDVPTGRLLRFTPSIGELKTHINTLLFANRVALGQNDEYVLLRETGGARIHRLWLKGDKPGQRAMFVSKLPTSVNNMTFNGRDTFWGCFT